MGVPKFYRWTSERYPCLSEVINENQIPEFDNLYLDMNGIIHTCSHPNDDDVTFRITEEEIFVNIFAYIENLYNLIRPQKVFFMAVDGVAPRAKMNQQRARRFMSARTAEEQMRRAISKGQKIPDEERFDSNCITPGTFFMTRLHNRLAQWIEKKIHQDSNWQNRRIYLSGHDCPGEGEHKIMDFIRTERASDAYDPNTRHCMYGLDADLIMLGIVSHEPHFSLLREEVTFSRPRKDKSKPGRNDSDTKTFHLLHLSLLREYLAWEFADIKTILPFEYDMERIADDWILMGLLVGNDFLPHLPHVHIHDDALPLLYQTYRSVLPTLDGYINEGGYLNLKRFEKFLIELSKNDKSCFMGQMEDEQFMNSKRTKPADGEEQEEDLVAFENSDTFDDGEALEGDGADAECISEDEEDDCVDAAFLSSDEEEEGEEETSTGESKDEPESSYANTSSDPVMEEFEEALALANLMSLDDKEFENSVEACWTKTINNSFKRYKKNYYSDKLKYKNISKTELKEQAEGYVRAIQWNLHYYYHGCPSWSWFYPHHYAPYISDVIGFTDMKIEFDLSKPFKPFEQLLGVLPAASSGCLPKPLQELMSDDAAASPIADFYPNNFKIDLNGKKNDWEAVVLIPFIDERRLIEAMNTKIGRLTAEENARNTHGPHLLFTSKLTSGKVYVSRKSVDKDEFRIDRARVKWGLLPNVKMDIFFPGFPTMKHLKHYGQLRNANVNVFGMVSKRKSVVLKVESPAAANEKDIIEWAGELLDEEVCIEWPMLKLGRIESIWGDGRILRKSESEEILVKDMNNEEQKQWVAHVNAIQDRLMTRYAIEVEEKKSASGKAAPVALAWVQKFTGLVYQLEQDENNQGAPIMKPVKQFASKDQAVPVLLPLVVKDLLLENSCRLGNLPMKIAYPMHGVVYVTDPKVALFGYPAMVQGYKDEKMENCTVSLLSMVMDSQVEKMEELRKEIDRRSLRWLGGYDAARNCGVNVSVFQRITGTILMWNEERKKVERGQQMSSDSKMNIGLGLKYSRRNLMAVEYARRIESNSKEGHKVWVYSNLTCRLVAEYKKKFPEVINYLERHSDSEDVYYAEDVWSGKKREARFAELKEFITSLPSAEAEKLSCDTELADRQIIAEIEKLIVSQPAGMKKAFVSPKFLFNPQLYEGKVLFDAEADFQLLDRVVCIGSGYNIQKTTQGTIVGIHGEKVDVLFDKEFAGGSNVRGSKKASSIRLPKHALMNITYGLKRKNRKRAELEDAKRQIRSKKSRGENSTEGGEYVMWNGRKKNEKRPTRGEMEVVVASPRVEIVDEQVQGKKKSEPRAMKSEREVIVASPRVEIVEQVQGKKISLGELMGIPSGEKANEKRRVEGEQLKVLMRKIEESAAIVEAEAVQSSKVEIKPKATWQPRPSAQNKKNGPQITDLKPSTVNRAKITPRKNVHSSSSSSSVRIVQRGENSSEKEAPKGSEEGEMKKKIVEKPKNSKSKQRKESRLAINFS